MALAISASNWTHGNDINVETANWIVIRHGRGSLVDPGSSNINNGWVHFAIPTPKLLLYDKPMQYITAYVRFQTMGSAYINRVHIYDGENVIQQYNGLHVVGTIHTETFSIKPQGVVVWGSGISIFVVFAEQREQVEFISAGIDYGYV
jgi:hypothetical protein